MKKMLSEFPSREINGTDGCALYLLGFYCVKECRFYFFFSFTMTALAN